MWSHIIGQMTQLKRFNRHQHDKKWESRAQVPFFLFFVFQLLPLGDHLSSAQPNPSILLSHINPLNVLLRYIRESLLWSFSFLLTESSTFSIPNKNCNSFYSASTSSPSLFVSITDTKPSFKASPSLFLLSFCYKSSLWTLHQGLHLFCALSSASDVWPQVFKLI